jgi:hypothetical protein
MRKNSPAVKICEYPGCSICLAERLSSAVKATIESITGGEVDWLVWHLKPSKANPLGEEFRFEWDK